MRSEDPADYDEIRALVTLAMRPEDAELVDLVRRSEHYVADLALVAEEGPLLVGYALFSYVTLHGTAPGPVLALAPLCVRPATNGGGWAAHWSAPGSSGRTPVAPRS